MKQHLLVILAILTLSITPTYATEGTFYFDIGISTNYNGDAIYIAEKHYAIEWEGPFATFELGYTKNDWTGYALHKSSIEQRDTGTNEIGIKHRLFKW